MPPTVMTFSSTTGPSTATSSDCGASSDPWTVLSRPSIRSTAPAIPSPMAEPAQELGAGQLLWTRRASLTVRILAVNIIALGLLAGSLFYLDNYRRDLMAERFVRARAEAEITANALS